MLFDFIFVLKRYHTADTRIVCAEGTATKINRAGNLRFNGEFLKNQSFDLTFRKITAIIVAYETVANATIDLGVNYDKIYEDAE